MRSPDLTPLERLVIGLALATCLLILAVGVARCDDLTRPTPVPMYRCEPVPDAPGIVCCSLMRLDRMVRGEPRVVYSGLSCVRVPYRRGQR